MRTLIAFILLAVPGAVGAPEFIGILSSPQFGTQYAVLPESGAAPRWVKIGDLIGDYVVVSFRGEEQSLVFKKGENELSAKLRSPHVQHADFRGQPLSFVAAKQLIASDPDWRSEVSYLVHRAKDGGVYLEAIRRTGNRIHIRLLPLIRETIPAEMHVPSEGMPNQAPEPTSGTVTPPAGAGAAPVPPVAHH